MTVSKKILAGTMALPLLLSGCSFGGEVTSNAGEAETVETIVIGGLAPLTGDASSYGIEFQRIAEIALADVNAVWAEKGMALDIQWEDGACAGGDAATAAQKLVGVDQVQVILGGFCSSETLAAAPITEAEQVLLFSPGSSSPDITNAGEYVYRNWPSDAYQGKKLAEMATELGYTTVALLSEQQDYTLGISTVFKATFEAAGGTVIEETYLSEDTDFKTQLTKLKAENPDIYFVNPQTPVKADVIFKQMQELGIEGPFLISDAAGTSAEVLSTHQDYLEGSYTATVAIDTESDELIRLQSAYKEQYNEDIAYLSYMAAVYDAIWILANAIEAEGNDATEIKDYLDSFAGYTGLSGTVTFDANGDPNSGHSIFKVEAGALVLQ